MSVNRVCHRGISNSQISDHDASHIDIVIGAGRSLDDDGALNTVCVLGDEMAVIPRRTVRGGNPLVDAGVTWCKTTLGHTWNTVLIVGIELTDTVPMDGGGIIGQGVVNSDLDGITPVANDGRAGNLAVHGKSGSWGSLKVPVDAGDGKVVLAHCASIGVGHVLIGVDVHSIAPLVSATWGVAAVVGDCGLGRCAWVGCPGGHDGPCLGDLGDGGRILTGGDGAEETAVGTRAIGGPAADGARCCGYCAD